MNHFLTYNKLRGISGKIKSMSFIWYLEVPCVTNTLVTYSSRKVGLGTGPKIDKKNLHRKKYSKFFWFSAKAHIVCAKI